MKITAIKFNRTRKKKNKLMITLISLCFAMIAILFISATNKTNDFLRFFIGIDFNDPVSVVSNQINIIDYNGMEILQEKETETIVKAAEEKPAVIPKKKEKLPVLTLDMHPTVATKGYLASDGVLVKNHTSLKPNISGLLLTKLSVKSKMNGPQVLIIHTHASEAFKPTASDKYSPSDPSRTQDMNYTVMRVGKEMAYVLNNAGIETIQDRSVHDYPSYNGSYASALASTKRYLKKYPSIKCVIDVHRDAMQRKDGTRIKNITKIDGKSAAQVMIVCGTNQMGLYHPNWQKNLAFACQFQRQMNIDYKSFTRPIDLREERFNTQTTNNSIILEIGSVANTLDEAILGGKYSAESLAKLLKSM